MRLDDKGDHNGSPLPAVQNQHSLADTRPVIHGPHWKWLIIGYFWTGGIAAGSLVIACLATLTGDGRIARAGSYMALAALVPSPVLLILDLGRPERFWRMITHVNPRSPMSLGTWGLMVFSGCCGLTATRQMADDGFLVSIPGATMVQRIPDRALAGMSLAPALFLGGYTGILLGATAVPLWARLSRVLGPLFLTSAMSTGAAATALVSTVVNRPDRAALERLARIEAASGAVELALLGLALTRDSEVRAALTSQPSHRGLLAGVMSGILVPRLLTLLGRNHAGTAHRVVHIAGPVLTLAGGFALRTLMVLAGRASADDPDATFRLARR